MSVKSLIWYTLESIPLITGDAQLLRVISEAMRQPGRTPETVAAEIARGPNRSISQDPIPASNLLVVITIDLHGFIGCVAHVCCLQFFWLIPISCARC